MQLVLRRWTHKVDYMHYDTAMMDIASFIEMTVPRYADLLSKDPSAVAALVEEKISKVYPF